MKILGIIVTIVSVIAALFIIYTGNYMCGVASVAAQFGKYWIGIGITIVGWIVGLLGSSVGVFLIHGGRI